MYHIHNSKAKLTGSDSADIQGVKQCIFYFAGLHFDDFFLLDISLTPYHRQKKSWCEQTCCQSYMEKCEREIVSVSYYHLCLYSHVRKKNFVVGFWSVIRHGLVQYFSFGVKHIALPEAQTPSGCCWPTFCQKQHPVPQGLVWQIESPSGQLNYFLRSDTLGDWTQKKEPKSWNSKHKYISQLKGTVFKQYLGESFFVMFMYKYIGHS